MVLQNGHDLQSIITGFPFTCGIQNNQFGFITNAGQGYLVRHAFRRLVIAPELEL